jgi:glycosyltransferase involved in cell wall biosynthesis
VSPHSDWLQEAATDSEVQAFAIPAGIRLLMGVRADLVHLKPEQLLDRIAAYAWWESDLRQEYGEMEWVLTADDLDVLRGLRAVDLFGERGLGFTRMLKGNWPSVLDLVPGFTELTRKVLVDEQAFTHALPKPLQLIWSDRTDLQESFDTTRPSGRIGLLMWWFNFGHKEYSRVAWRVDPSLRKLCTHGPNGELALPQFLSLIVQGRDDLWNLYPLETPTGWLGALVWWQRGGFAEFSVPSWSLHNHTALRRQLSTRSGANTELGVSAAKALPYLSTLIWSSRADLQTAFNLTTSEGYKGFEHWWNTNGSSEYASVLPLFVNPDSELPGMNIVGYSQAIIGIAEDVRMAVRSADSAGIPCAVIDAPMPGPARLDHTLDPRTVEVPSHPVSLYCLPPTEMIRLGMEGGRGLLNAGHYNIGAWHWELPTWPAHFARIQQMVDEVWVFSDYVKAGFSALTDIPVRRMPLAVELPETAGPDRQAFGLPAKKFLFLVMFDGNSWLSRKNPVGAVRAFKAAFPTDRDVGLVIKAISLEKNSAGWKSMLQEIDGDERVVVIDKSLSRVDVTRLMASCDAYVSLHRSEGFGRIIAEAMLLGIPTVTTNFSGNVDFCTRETSYLVDGELVPLNASEYLFAEGQFWCDPDISQASSQMLRVRNNASERLQFARTAQRNIAENYSIEAVAKSYTSRLQQLRQDNRI